ncbi:uncharacterized protein [Argopecten irradians]|uniref:uncharacterized protein n=1 Tax=Argopecten irradians TaxID=31199 RepID=UPI003713365B
MFVKFILIICVCNYFELLYGLHIDPGNKSQPWQKLNPWSNPKRLEDFESYVNEKFDIMERLLSEKDERVDELESKLAAQERITLQNDNFIDSLVKRVSDLEATVKAITENQETRLNTITDFDASENDYSNQMVSDFHKTGKLGELINSEDSFPHGNRSLKNTSAIRRRDTKAFSSRMGSPKQLGKYNEDRKTAIVPSESVLRQYRVAMTPPVAFHAVLSNNKVYAENAIVVYDTEKLDNGNAYNPADGLYMVPQTGTYVLTWTTICGTHQEFQTVLEVNGVVRGASFTDSSAVGDFHQSTAVVVSALNKGDHVFIRVGPVVGHWTIISASHSYGLSTFSGWKLD